MSLAARSLALAQALGADIKALGKLTQAEGAAGGSTLLLANSGMTYSISDGIVTLPSGAGDGAHFKFIGVGFGTGEVKAPAGVTLAYQDGTDAVAGSIRVPRYGRVLVVALAGSWFSFSTASAPDPGFETGFLLMGA